MARNWHSNLTVSTATVKLIPETLQTLKFICAYFSNLNSYHLAVDLSNLFSSTFPAILRSFQY